MRYRVILEHSNKTKRMKYELKKMGWRTRKTTNDVGVDAYNEIVDTVVEHVTYLGPISYSDGLEILV